MDSDYNHVPTGGCSLSDAGGTMGSQNQSLSNFSNAASAFGSMAPSVAKFGTGSLAGDSVERRDMNYYGKQYSLPQREEMLEIYAPSGKLGLVIDTPNDTTSSTTTPIVHAIKDSCPIRHEIYVGDKLVAVDDMDVRDMTAVEVSKLISKKSGQEKRKLTVIRTARGRDGMY